MSASYLHQQFAVSGHAPGAVSRAIPDAAGPVTGQLGFRHGYSAASTGRPGANRDRIRPTFALRNYSWPQQGRNGHQIISDDWYAENDFGPAWWDNPEDEHGLVERYVDGPDDDEESEDEDNFIERRLVVGEVASSKGGTVITSTSLSAVQASQLAAQAKARAWTEWVNGGKQGPPPEGNGPPPKPSWYDGASYEMQAYYDKMSNDLKWVYGQSPVVQIQKEWDKAMARGDRFVTEIARQLDEWRKSFTTLAVVGMLSAVAVAGFFFLSGTGKVAAREGNRTARSTSRHSAKMVSSMAPVAAGAASAIGPAMRLL